ncbi:MAG TPA: TM0106 family RecB-like putative nuclease, partial [Thermoanaerobaculia bacterium]
PDFLIRRGTGHVIRDSKLARKASSTAIALQLQTYGWLYERWTGRPPIALEVHSGSGEVLAIPYDGGGAALGYFRFLRSIREAQAEPYEPVGWSKCGDCGYHDRCWTRAETSRDLALVPAVNQDMARALAFRGVRSYEDLLDRFGEQSLAALAYRNGSARTVGGKAPAILRAVRAVASGTEAVLAHPDLPDVADCAWFDLEGAPARADELDKVYLWGIKTPDGIYRHALAGLTPDGDRDAWRAFLATAVQLLDGRPARRFIHWGDYEKTKLDGYAKRYGDPDGAAARLQQSLLDLHRATVQSVLLPVPSYSLKVVERWVGFERRLSETDGRWAMARYIEAVETKDEGARRAIFDEILAYNEEDLDAMAAVLDWLRGRFAREPTPDSPLTAVGSPLDDERAPARGQ